MNNITVKVHYKSPDWGKKTDEDYFSSSRKFLKMTGTGYYFTSVTSAGRATQQETKSKRFLKAFREKHH